MSEWIRVRDNELDRDLTIQRVSLPHGDYTELEDKPALDHNDVPWPPRFGDDPEPWDVAAAEAAESLEAAGVVDYDARNVPWLRDEIARRNKDRDEHDQIPAKGNKPDLIAALKADDNKEN